MSIITQIYINKLFDYLDYKIPLNTTENITIIHGPNGSGKTWILHLINAVFARDYATLRASPFREIGFKFRDGGDFSVRRYPEEAQPPSRMFVHPARLRAPQAKLVFSYYSRRTKKPKEFSLPFSSSAATEAAYPLSLIEQEIPTLTRVGPRGWREPGHLP